jgi:hypothetical protein
MNFLRTALNEIIVLSKKSDILADKKAKIFCNYYLNLKNESKVELMTTLCQEHGLKLDKIYDKVNFF